MRVDVYVEMVRVLVVTVVVAGTVVLAVNDVFVEVTGGSVKVLVLVTGESTYVVAVRDVVLVVVVTFKLAVYAN
jgi:hypothetical protein